MIRFKGNKDDLNKCGIYCILNLKDGKRYIGSTSNFENRLRDHFKNLTAKRHANIFLQNAYNKYGNDYFEFKILEICSNSLSTIDLLSVEQKYLDDIFKIKNHYDYHYNMAVMSNSPMAGRKHSKETIQKMSGKTPHNKGKSLTEEQKRHLSEINSGEKNPNFGKKRSAETKKKISDSRFGSDNPGYISEIEAKNVETGEIKTGSSYNDIAKMFGVSRSAVQRRLNKDHEKYTEKLINDCWKIYRINNEEK